MVVKNLEFFDKYGYNLNLNWNDENKIWEGNIYFPRLSVGLYENTTIYAIEYIKSDSDGYDSDSDYMDDAYSYPTGEGNIVFQWDLANSFVDEFFMFNFDEDYELKDTSSLIYTPYDGPVCEPLIINRFDKYIVPLLGSSQDIKQDDLLEIHVAFKADEKSAETTYKRTLVISYENGYTKYNIARITFFAETIEEDERLKVWNDNLGYNLKPEDIVIFKESDINEYMPNFELLNEKRKELMLEGHNIYPYIGSYKAILNAIKFFGYDNLNIVEYWRNINIYDNEYWKIYRTYVYSLNNRKTLSTKRKPISLDTKNFQKLNNISLVYNINHPEAVDGKKYDEYGLPNVIEDFDKNKRDDFRLTIEEAIVKLFALKRKLNDEFMPGSTVIKDIIGEGNYFGINLIGNNPQISTVNYIESKGYVDFSVFPNKHCYITENEDFARYVAEKMEIHVDNSIENIGENTIESMTYFYDDSDSDSDTIEEIDTRSLGHIISDLMNGNNDIVCKYYEDYYNITRGYSDDEYLERNIPKVRNIYKDIVLDDIINDPYGENEYVPDIDICAKVILKGNFSENIDKTSIIEWKISHKEKNWSETHTGDVNKCGNIFVQLPYLGNYDVELIVWDVYNHCCKKYTENAIIVDPYNIDIRGFYYDARPLPDDINYDLYIPNEYLNEDDIESQYIYKHWSKKEGNTTKGIITNNIKPSNMTLLDIIAVYTIDGDNLDNSIILDNITNTDNEHWTNIINSEDDNVLKLSWLYNDEDGNILYGIDEFNFVDTIVGDIFLEDGESVEDWDSDELYRVIKENVDRMYSFALQEHLNTDDINSSMRNYRPDGSVNFKGPYYKFDVDTILYKAKRGYKEYDHLNEEIINLYHGEHYKYVRYIHSIVDIKPLTWVLLGFDNTKIAGRLINEEYPKWTLTMVGDKLDPDESLREDKVITTHNGLYFTYLFEDEGEYKIKLEIIDIKGNKYELERYIAIVDKDANYKMYHSLNDEYNNYIEE